AGDIVWPTPEWTPFEGSNLITFAYEHEVFLPIPVTVPASFDGDQFKVSTKIDWQVCDEICIPGDAVFNLVLPVSDQSRIDPAWEIAFEQTRASLPRADHNLTSQFNTHDGKVNIMVDAGENLFGDVTETYFFTEQGRVMKYAPFRQNLIEDQRIQISLEQHRRMPADLAELKGVLAVYDESGNRRSFAISPTRTPVAWSENVEVELLAATSNIVPAEQTWLGIRLKAAPGWHTYWKLGGDSGEPTQAIDWSAPEGTEIGDIRWPAPYWLPFPGSDLVNYGYEGEVVLPIPVEIPADVEGDQVTFSTTVKWYVCELICIPGEHRLDLVLPIADVAVRDPRNAALAEKARSEVPQRDHDLEFIIAVAGERVSLGIQTAEPIFNDVTDAWFFPERRRVIANGPIRDVTIQPNLIQITHAQPRRMVSDLSEIYGMLVVADAQGVRRSFEFVDPAADANKTVITPMGSASGTDKLSTDGGFTFTVLLGYIGAALLGGLILNLMPCVFPVLSLKALSFTSNAGAGARKQRLDGLVYTGGVIVSFLLLATVLYGLRMGGALVGWGFQLQEPWFIALIIYLFFTMALSLSGVFEIGAGLMNTGSGLSENSHGYRRSFYNGVLATIVATPCTAPFMGPALGFALTQSWLVAMVVFFALGLGMALPILALSFMPALVRFMPKPGNWMVTFKEFMAFPLYATALYFLWVLGNQVGITGMSLVLGACVLLAFASWLFKQRQTAGPFWRYANSTMAIICLLLAGYTLQTSFLSTASTAAIALNEDGSANQLYEKYSAQRLDELQSLGKPVFINMTAAWCITCLANEQTTLGTDAVHQAMLENGITYLKGDWTNEDPEITKLLNQFNRPSVPLYLLFSGDRNKEPTILPQILTPSIVIAAFNKI
ncbi:MAG: thioredoxin family protein, partial [Gammaproteobacteria bacterium]|nr:thioredoxin family protein [Gammaproteobacteria bacterium]